jgi:hypothetical protein
MSRFFKAFLRDQLGGRMHVAGFGKHPAWDDHIDDIGLETETLVRAKQLLYAQGIASQLASGIWDQLEKTRQSVEFDHRFVWARKGQTLIGTILASSDGKGRARFPMVVCVQAEIGALHAIRLCLPFAESLGKRCKAASSQQEVRESLNSAPGELNASPVVPGANAVFAHPEFQGDDFILQSMGHLGAALRSGHRSCLSIGRRNCVSFRLRAISVRALESLEFWSGYLELCARTEVPYLAIASIGRSTIDLIVGEPTANDFFCLRADETALPLTRNDAKSRQATNIEREAKEYVESFKRGTGTDSGPRRSWWPRLFSKIGQ